MKKITNKEITKKLKSRLNTQRRIFNFDNDQILVLPVLEHPNGVSDSIDKIKFYINERGEFLTLNNIEGIKKEKDGSITVVHKNKKELTLFYRKMNGSFGQVIKNNFDFSDLTIDHSPSIHTVLFTMYLNKGKEYSVLKDFYRNISSNKMKTSEITAAGFRDKVLEYLNSSLNKNEIIEAYKELFDPIELEIIPKENNNANLSMSSLEFYFNNKNR